MTIRLPHLEVSGPDGQHVTIPLTADRITVGRLKEINDVALEPDPQQLVTRHVHCVIEREAGAWWVLDNGSVNGTFLRRAEIVEMVHGRAPLTDGDVIRVLGRLPEKGEPVYWELAFVDPLKTQAAGLNKGEPHLEYDWIQAKLLLVDGMNRVSIALRPQEHKLIRYMVQRNSANGNVPVLCTHEELVVAVWGENTHHRSEDLNHLVWEIRVKIPRADEVAKFFEAERGLGYRLRTCP